MSDIPYIDHVKVYADQWGRASLVECCDKDEVVICNLPVTSISQTFNAHQPGEVSLSLYGFRVRVIQHDQP